MKDFANATRVQAGHGLLATEAFERLAYCGSQLLLLLYLQSLFASADGPGTLLYAYSAALFGSTNPSALAVQIVALFMAASQLAALVGAMVARHVDTRLVVALGCFLMTAGHLALAEPPLVFPALLALILGAGCTTSNKLVQFGALLRTPPEGRTGGYASYTIAVNAGVMLAPLVCGTLAERWSWAWGFRAAAGSMAIGLCCYLWVWRALPAGLRPPSSNVRSVPVRKRHHRIVVLLLPLIPYVVLLTVVNQAYTLALLWASSNVARDVGGFVIPITWVATVDGLASIAGLILARAIWRRQAVRGAAWSDLTKVAVGAALLASAYLYLAIISTWVMPSILLFVSFFLLLDVAAAWIDPAMEAFISVHSPVGDTGLMMGVLKGSGVVAALLLGWLGRQFDALGAPAYWLLNAGIAGLAAITVLIMRSPVERSRSVQYSGVADPDTSPDGVLVRNT